MVVYVAISLPSFENSFRAHHRRLPCSVVFQQPRPGLPLPKGAHYVTIGWKQVRLSQYQHVARTRTCLNHDLIDLGCAPAIQTAPIHIHILDGCLLVSGREFLESLHRVLVWISTNLGAVEQGWNTTLNLVLICQNNTFQFSLLQNTYLSLAHGVASVIR